MGVTLEPLAARAGSPMALPQPGAMPAGIALAKSGESAPKGIALPARGGAIPFKHVLQQQKLNTVQDNENSPDAAEAKRRKEAETAAAGLVSNALILPILQQVRRSPFG